MSFRLCSEPPDEPRWKLDVDGTRISVPGVETPSQEHVGRAEALAARVSDVRRFVSSSHSSKFGDNARSESTELLGIDFVLLDDANAVELEFSVAGRDFYIEGEYLQDGRPNFFFRCSISKLTGFASATHTRSTPIPGDNGASADKRVSRKIGTTTHSYSVNSANQLTGHGMQYDGNGNLTAHTDPSTGKRYTYEWDAISRLRAIMVDNNGDGSFASGDTRTEFFYNGAGERYRKVEKDWSGSNWDTPASSDRSYYIWCGGEICQKRVGTSSYTGVTANYFADGETRHATISQKTKYFYNFDHQGSVREVTDSNKNVLAAYDYTPFGERIWKGSGSDTFNCEFAFTGHFYHPQSGLHLALYRAYDPRTGRWLSQDPLGESGGMNLYGYMINDPMNGYDPDGRMPEWLADGILGFDEHLAPYVLGPVMGTAQGRNLLLGFSDNWLWGIPRMIRGADGVDSTADPCSGFYRTGQIVSIGTSLATGIKGATNAAGGLRNIPFYELGQKWLPHLSNPANAGKLAMWMRRTEVQRGHLLLRAANGNWLKAFLPRKSADLLKPFAPNALKTGPTPLSSAGVHIAGQAVVMYMYRNECP